MIGIIKLCVLAVAFGVLTSNVLIPRYGVIAYTVPMIAGGICGFLDRKYQLFL